MSYLERRFLAIQKCAVPRSADFTEEQARESLQLLTRFLAQKPLRVRLLLTLFLVYIDGLSLLHGARAFPGLDGERQHRVLKRLYDSPIALIRKGFWGLNTLSRLGVYGQSSVYPSLHYKLRPTPHE